MCNEKLSKAAKQSQDSFGGLFVRPEDSASETDGDKKIPVRLGPLTVGLVSGANGSIRYSASTSVGFGERLYIERGTKMEDLKNQMVALLEVIFIESFHGYTLQPKLGVSTDFKYRNAEIDLRICEPCHEKYGTVYPAETAPTTQEIKEHLFCRCTMEGLKSILAGTATVNGLNGADFVEVLPSISLYEEHENRKGKLPTAPNHKWYEADINYHGGRRNSQRLLFSDDGLIFVSYDHYQTYFQIV